ncbi:peroxiredoxin [Pelagibacterales bacterium SAG-MED23]|nr:peroxiredoxin [Pelagibacterales bacterium SAG-MED23]
MKLKVKDQIPDSKIFHLVDGEPKEQNISEVLGVNKIILFGLPGAFTTTCSKFHLPGFVANAQKILDKGIDKIFCLAVNDPYVMNAWGEENNIENNIKMLADPYLSFTKSIGAEIDRNFRGMGTRSSRYAMIIHNLQVQNIQEEEETKNCRISSADNILSII